MVGMRKVLAVEEFSGADGPVAGGFVVGVWGGVAVALNEVDDAEDVSHKPFAAREVKLMLIEPKGVVNTGDAGGEMTAENDVWV